MNQQELINIIKQFQGKKISVIGDIMLDHYVYGETPRVNPERPGAPLLTITDEDHRLGGAANAAARPPGPLPTTKTSVCAMTGIIFDASLICFISYSFLQWPYKLIPFIR